MKPTMMNYDSVLRIFEGGHDCPLINFVQEMVEGEDGIGVNDRKAVDEMGASDEGFDLAMKYAEVAFCLGVLFNRLFDITDPDALDTLDSLEQEAREKCTIPYWPRRVKSHIDEHNNNNLSVSSTPTP